MAYGRLPSLNTLRAFEAVARHGSFKRAADELNVTPGALSQQVRKLEQELGIELFERSNRGIRPTAAGDTLSAGLTDALLRVRDAVAAVRPVDDPGQLVVACAAPLAAKWLVPRMEHFIDRHPDVDLRVVSDYTSVAYGNAQIDVGIVLGEGPAEGAGTYSEDLAEETLLPLAAPGLVAARGLQAPSALSGVALLEDDSLGTVDGATLWSRWFDLAGLTAQQRTRTVSFGVHAEQALDAAIAGAGVVLGRRILAARDIECGSLVSPFGPELRTGVCYRFVCAEGKLRQPHVRGFRDWIREELGEPAR